MQPSVLIGSRAKINHALKPSKPIQATYCAFPSNIPTCGKAALNFSQRKGIIEVLTVVNQKTPCENAPRSKVCVADIQELKAEEFAREQQKIFGKGDVIAIHCDVSKESDYSKLFEQTLKYFKRVDVLVNNAGVLLEHDPRKCLEVNLLGPLFGCHAALKYMGKSKGGNGGVVINTASLAGDWQNCKTTAQFSRRNFWLETRNRPCNKPPSTANHNSSGQSGECQTGKMKIRGGPHLTSNQESRLNRATGKGKKSCFS
ncbi:hypothetical protein AVEN_73627-1 [Araneus ventricosus]|uniref:15-hydroxyprostaglandin dehydrogenase [NAD(+)] n=1 Tax=Araneus ventricosus TaxID=182803 RepID=A0A4Y2LKW0_ARAVE|nr:hypothetical protein AVEN_73627-1 [Araneus ventricosus]